MVIENYALGVQIDTGKIPLKNKEKSTFSLLFSSLTYDIMRDAEVCGGYPYADHPEVYLVVFKTEHYKPARRIFLRLRDSSALSVFLWDEQPFIDKNRLQHISELTSYGRLDEKKRTLISAPCGIAENVPELRKWNMAYSSRFRMMIAPDSFKGSLSAVDVTRIITLAVCESIFRGCSIIPMPMADGGEGTLDAFSAFAGAKRVKAEVHDPLGRLIKAEYAVLGDTAVIEMAQASGHMLLSDDERDVMRADTYGTGELILHAVNSGYRNIIVALGGSATNDGGTGCARALGVRFMDSEGREVTDVGEGLLRIKDMDVSLIPAAVRRTHITAMCDVDNPLTGRNGATMVFSPQKGADRSMAACMELGMRNLANIYDTHAHRKVSESKGAGAAGGMGAMLCSVFGADMRKGIDTVLEISNFDEKARSADIIITGEGRLDAQTFSGGKTVAGVISHAGDTPCAVLCGAICESCCIDSLPAMAAVASCMTERDAINCAPEAVYAAAKRMLALISIGQRTVNN